LLKVDELSISQRLRCIVAERRRRHATEPVGTALAAWAPAAGGRRRTQEGIDLIAVLNAPEWCVPVSLRTFAVIRRTWR
jgi:hypothetical protein